MNNQEQTPHVRARRTRDGWHIELDNAAWVQLLSALAIAIDTCELSKTPTEDARAAALKKLQTALSHDAGDPR